MLAKEDDESVVAEAATAFSFQVAEGLHQEWLDFYGELFATFFDGYRVERPTADSSHDSKAFGFVKRVFGLRDLMKHEIIATTGDRYQLYSAAAPSIRLAVPTDKRCLRSFGGTLGCTTSSIRNSVSDSNSPSQSSLQMQWPVIMLVAAGACLFSVGYGRSARRCENEERKYTLLV